jgi:uncharacterized membrane protein YqjE
MAEQRGEKLTDKSVAELLRELSQQTVKLVREEVELAKAEVKETGKRAGVGAGLLGGAGVAALLALGALTACLILALATVVPAWLAALIVAALEGGVAAVLALQGKRNVEAATPPAPRTVETIKEDAQWARHPTTSSGR